MEAKRCQKASSKQKQEQQEQEQAHSKDPQIVRQPRSPKARLPFITKNLCLLEMLPIMTSVLQSKAKQENESSTLGRLQRNLKTKVHTLPVTEALGSVVYTFVCMGLLSYSVCMCMHVPESTPEQRQKSTLVPFFKRRHIAYRVSHWSGTQLGSGSWLESPRDPPVSVPSALGL